MRHAEASRTFIRLDNGAIKIVGPNMPWSAGVAGLAAAIMIAGAMLAFASVQADAKPSYVTPAKPCGSCHPPNKPPTKK